MMTHFSCARSAATMHQGHCTPASHSACLLCTPLSPLPRCSSRTFPVPVLLHYPIYSLNVLLPCTLPVSLLVYLLLHSSPALLTLSSCMMPACLIHGAIGALMPSFLQCTRYSNTCAMPLQEKQEEQNMKAEMMHALQEQLAHGDMVCMLRTMLSVPTVQVLEMCKGPIPQR